MEPTCAVFAKNLIPIDIAGLQLRNRGVSAIGAANCGPNSESSFSEVQSIADSAANAVIVNPANEALVNSALMEQVLKQTAGWIVGNGCDNRRRETETALEATGDVVFASALGNCERASGRDAAIAGIK